RVLLEQVAVLQIFSCYFYVFVATKKLSIKWLKYSVLKNIEKFHEYIDFILYLYKDNNSQHVKSNVVTNLKFIWLNRQVINTFL
ncbi:MAG: hypothetical protein SVU94_03095, partial [Bacteroidota bacterium]|nr:hypothetical protein [Bacteroidota bacterium]